SNMMQEHWTNYIITTPRPVFFSAHQTELSRNQTVRIDDDVKSIILDDGFWKDVDNLLKVLNELVIGISIFESDTPCLSKEKNGVFVNKLAWETAGKVDPITWWYRNFSYSAPELTQVAKKVQEKPAEEKPASVKKKPTEEQSVAKKAPPPVPLKPNCLKVKPAPVINEDPIPEESSASIESDTDEIIDSFSDCYLSDEEPDQENEPPAEEPAFEADDDYDVLDDLLSDSDSIITNPAHEQQPESPASVTKSDPEFVVELTPEEQPIPEPVTEPEVDQDPEPKEGTQAHWAWQERHRWDCKPWVKNSKDQIFNDLYNTGFITTFGGAPPSEIVA
ncbi:hypothetical protein RhiirA1_401377, partial [Rhizophagus irregularis]